LFRIHVSSHLQGITIDRYSTYITVSSTAVPFQPDNDYNLVPLNSMTTWSAAYGILRDATEVVFPSISDTKQFGCFSYGWNPFDIGSIYDSSLILSTCEYFWPGTASSPQPYFPLPNIIHNTDS
jgi:hypothetical protein